MSYLIETSAAIIGFVNGVRLLKAKDYWGFIFFAIALVTGIVLGALHLFGLTIETGLIAGLVSSGFYRVAEKVGSQ